MSFYDEIVRPALFMLDPEQAHHFASGLMPLLKPMSFITGRPFHYSDPALLCTLAERQLDNPVGLAAGFDKNGHCVDVLSELGFGFAEIGSITGRPSNGNPQPRLFRLPGDKAIINRLGLNGEGADAVAARLGDKKASVPFAINIAKTNDPAIQGEAGIADQVHSFEAIKHLPIIYVAINTSCPNTHDGCLQAKDELDTLLGEIQKRNDRALPLFLKLSPDSSDELLQDFVLVATSNGIKGFVCGNTTVSREGLQTSAQTVKSIGNGGLSGPPLKALALSLVQRVNRLKSPEQEIIACGGISSGADAFEFIKSGASTVEIYTAFVYQGPAAASTINRELAKLLKKEGTSIKELIGSNQVPSQRP